MSEDVKGISLSVKLEDARLLAGVEVDIVEVLRELAAKSDNTVDDALVQIVATARDNADWKGLAKTLF